MVSSTNSSGIASAALSLRLVRNNSVTSSTTSP
ncbi:Uncharacterised protein [Mycobacteroides abscessus subsp. abscessus]|nr:Uncharacterised protein [Mycobacteroides abscessus subsp. abscessus]